MDQQKVTVTGYIDERKVLKVVRRTGRRAELWPFPYDSEYYPYAARYLDESTYTTSYNYYRHGFNESVHGYFPDQAYSTVPDQTVHLFSDDNVHAYCTIMWLYFIFIRNHVYIIIYIYITRASILNIFDLIIRSIS